MVRFVRAPGEAAIKRCAGGVPRRRKGRSGAISRERQVFPRAVQCGSRLDGGKIPGPFSSERTRTLRRKNGRARYARSAPDPRGILARTGAPHRVRVQIADGQVNPGVGTCAQAVPSKCHAALPCRSHRSTAAAGGREWPARPAWPRMSLRCPTAVRRSRSTLVLVMARVAPTSDVPP